MSRTVISFCWRNDTWSFVTWRSRLATAPDTPTCIVIHSGQFTGGVHPPNQFILETVSPSPCSPTLVCHTLLIVYFFKELISVNGSTRPGSSVVSESDSWPGDCEFDPRLRRLFFPAYFHLSPLQKHVRKVVDGFRKESCVSAGVRKLGDSMRHRPPWYDLSC